MASVTGPRWTLENLHREGVSISEDGYSFLVDKNHPAMQLIINNLNAMSHPCCPIQMELIEGVYYRTSPFLFSKCCESIKNHGHLP
jgi:hypothetical protein